MFAVSCVLYADAAHRKGNVSGMFAALGFALVGELLRGTMALTGGRHRIAAPVSVVAAVTSLLVALFGTAGTIR